MQRIFAIGETVIDIIFKKLEVKEAKPGGSMLNSAVSLGRAGRKVHFISEFANDQIGNLVNEFLIQNNIDTQYIFRHDKGKTSIAMALLDDKNDASYVFYKEHPDDRLNTSIPEFQPGDILLFGSFFGIDPVLRHPVMNLVSKARMEGALVIYDPNFRKSHAEKLDELRPFIVENIAASDIVRGSNEDFLNIFQTDNPNEIRNIIGTEISVLLMTMSSEKVFLNTINQSYSMPVKKISPISTIGAGDNFNAGLIFGLTDQNITKQNIHKMTKNQWIKILDYGINFASNVCMSYENYISPEFADALKK